LRSGLFPSQQRLLRQAFKKADKFDHFRARTRRSFLAIIGASAVAVTGSFFIGHSVGSSNAPTPRPVPKSSRIAAAAGQLETLALGPLDQLEQAHPMLISYLDLHTTQATDAHWLGFERLLLLALSAPDAKRGLAREITRVAEVRSTPTHLQPLIEQLRQRSR
jgi:hypothetical protein